MGFRTILAVVAGIMLLLAIPPIWPYGYYVFLRIVVSVVAVINAAFLFKNNQNGWAATLTLIALLFNPIAPVYFGKAMWVLIDIAVAILMFISTAKLKPTTS